MKESSFEGADIEMFPQENRFKKEITYKGLVQLNFDIIQSITQAHRLSWWVLRNDYLITSIYEKIIRDALELGDRLQSVNTSKWEIGKSSLLKPEDSDRFFKCMGRV